MKKFFASIVLGGGIIFANPLIVAAQDVYIESDYSGGRDLYVVTESIDTNGVDYVNVTVKYIKNSALDYTEHRKYGKAGDGMWWRGNEATARGELRPTRVWEPAQDKILQYCLHYRR